MNRFKVFLKEALQRKADKLLLMPNHKAEMHKQAALGKISGPPIAEQEFYQIAKFLFPDIQQPRSGGVYRGELQVSGVGDLPLLFVNSLPPKLGIYLPGGGAHLFQKEWQYLSRKMKRAAGAKPPDAQQPANNAQAAPAPTPNSGARVDNGAGSEDRHSDPPAVGPQDEGPPVAIEALPPLAVPDLSSPPPSDIGLGSPDGLGGPADSPSDNLGDKNGFESPAAAVPIPELAIPAAAPPISPSKPPVPSSPSRVVNPADDVTITFGQVAADAGAKSDGSRPIDRILQDMIQRGASDVHITLSEPICMRIDGSIRRISERKVTEAEMAEYLNPIMPERNKREFVKSNDTDLAYEIIGMGRFRVNVFRDYHGVGTVIRHIPNKILSFEELNLPSALAKFCGLHKGLVLVTGPTGSGKSTTLAAMIDRINETREDHILTIEDPIEFLHPQKKCLVNQREIHRHTKGFTPALRAALREDPDIVLIGEMRDLETVSIAIETAETGHLVFGTLHTNTAVSTIDRLIDQFPSDQQEQIRMMLAGSLKGVVSQTLLKKKGGGRIAAHEILVTVDAVSAMIREGKNHMVPNHMQAQKADGNLLLNDSLVALVKAGTVELREAFAKSIDKTSFLNTAQRAGITIDLSQNVKKTG